jgi:hypothetical protein
MKRLVIITAIFLTAVSIQAAQQYYSFPDATKFYDTDRMLIYQSNSGSRNLTGSGLKNVIRQTAWERTTTKVFQASSSSAATTSGTSAKGAVAYFMRDGRGVITKIQWDNGGWFQGVPGHNHTYVYPFNGMTNVRRNTPLVVGSFWFARGYIGQGISIQGGPAITPQALFSMGTINGLPNFDFVDYNRVDQSRLDAFFWGVSSVGTLAANTTYTIRSEMTKRWGSTQNGLYSAGVNPCTYTMTNTSSAHVMVNYSGSLCRSTFRTGSI